MYTLIGLPPPLMGGGGSPPPLGGGSSSEVVFCTITPQGERVHRWGASGEYKSRGSCGRVDLGPESLSDSEKVLSGLGYFYDTRESCPIYFRNYFRVWYKA